MSRETFARFKALRGYQLSRANQVLVRGPAVKTDSPG